MGHQRARVASTSGALSRARGIIIANPAALPGNRHHSLASAGGQEDNMCGKSHPLRNSTRALGLCMLAGGFSVPHPAIAQPDYYRHVIFDNSLQTQQHYQSAAADTAPSELKSVGYRLPVESKLFRTPPNALRIEWQSAPGGSWDAQIHLVHFPNRYPG